MKVTLSNALLNEAEVIKGTNSALEGVQATLALALTDSLKVGDHISTPTIISMLKDLEDLKLKCDDRLKENENMQESLNKAQ